MDKINVIVLKNIPNDITEDQIKNVLQDHDPKKIVIVPKLKNAYIEFEETRNEKMQLLAIQYPEYQIPELGLTTFEPCQGQGIFNVEDILKPLQQEPKDIQISEQQILILESQKNQQAEANEPSITKSQTRPLLLEEKNQKAIQVGAEHQQQEPKDIQISEQQMLILESKKNQQAEANEPSITKSQKRPLLLEEKNQRAIEVGAEHQQQEPKDIQISEQQMLILESQKNQQAEAKEPSITKSQTRPLLLEEKNQKAIEVGAEHQQQEPGQKKNNLIPILASSVITIGALGLIYYLKSKFRNKSL